MVITARQSWLRPIAEGANRLLRAFLVATLGLQWLGGAYSSGFGGHPDEAAHFVSALMVRDFLAAGGLLDSMGFARDYYLHYPKVAIGHWPPVDAALRRVPHRGHVVLRGESVDLDFLKTLMQRVGSR